GVKGLFHRTAAAREIQRPDGHRAPSGAELRENVQHLMEAPLGDALTGEAQRRPGADARPGEAGKLVGEQPLETRACLAGIGDRQGRRRDQRGLHPEEAQGLEIRVRKPLGVEGTIEDRKRDGSRHPGCMTAGSLRCTADGVQWWPPAAPSPRGSEAAVRNPEAGSTYTASASPQAPSTWTIRCPNASSAWNVAGSSPN